MYLGDIKHDIKPSTTPLYVLRKTFTLGESLVNST